MKYLSTLVVLIFAILFTYFGFFEPQPCDLDAIYLSCRLNPFTGFDLVGCILIYLGCALVSCLPVLEKLELYNPEGSSAFNIAAFAGMVIGITLIWNL